MKTIGGMKRMLKRKAKKWFLVFLCGFGMICAGLLLWWSKKDSNTDKNTVTYLEDYSLKILGKEYTGEYNGKTEDGKPEGKGTYKADEITVKGSWKEGKPEGRTEITFTDGKKVIAKFKDGKQNGRMITYQDSGHVVETYKAGTAYGVKIGYDNENKIISLDRYYEGKLISTLIKKAKTIEYRNLINDPNTYIGLPVKVEGTVKYIKQTESKCHLMVCDEDERSYLIEYSNVHISKFKQGIVQNGIKKGDYIEIYGYFEDMAEFDYTFQSKDYGYSYPLISAFYCGDLIKNTVYPNTMLTYEYDHVYKNPYVYADLTCEIRVTVERIKVNYESQKVKIQAVDKDGNQYYVHCQYGEDDIIPVHGDEVIIKGKYNGNEVCVKKDKYYRALCLKATEIVLSE